MLGAAGVGVGVGGRSDLELVYLDVDEAEQWRRVQTRSLTTRSLTHSATTVPMSEADLERFRQLLQPPDAAELAMTEIEAPPPGFASWEAWASERWPTSVS